MAIKGEQSLSGVDPQVLVVDDDRVARYILSRFIRSHQCEVDTASSVQEALRFLACKVYDLIVIDGHLRDGQGTEIARYVRGGAFPLETPIVALSSDDGREHVDSLLAAGAHCFVKKPISATQVRDLLAEYGLLGGLDERN